VPLLHSYQDGNTLNKSGTYDDKELTLAYTGTRVKQFNFCTEHTLVLRIH